MVPWQTQLSTHPNAKGKFPVQLRYVHIYVYSWFCHVDDDTYINVPRLVKFLQDYDANGMWYLGKPSISHPIETRDPDRPGVSLWAEHANGLSHHA